MSILFISVAALGYDNYKAHERIVELEIGQKRWIYYASSYMLQYARCAYYVKYSCSENNH